MHTNIIYLNFMLLMHIIEYFVILYNTWEFYYILFHLLYAFLYIFFSFYNFYYFMLSENNISKVKSHKKSNLFLLQSTIFKKKTYETLIR